MDFRSACSPMSVLSLVRCPLLQDTLDLLWQRRQDRLQPRPPEEIGAVAGALYGAPTLFDGLPPTDQQMARRPLVRLVSVADKHLAEHATSVLTRCARMTLAKRRFDHLLSQLIESRLLVSDGEAGGRLLR